LINISGGSSLSFHEVNEAASLIQDAADDDAEIIFGSVIDPDLNEGIMVTVIATGFEERSRAVMPSYDKWRPARELSSLKGANRILSKTAMKRADDGVLDIPTFMRKSSADHEKEKDLTV
jgi:cell division protein FtsZ